MLTKPNYKLKNIYNEKSGFIKKKGKNKDFLSGNRLIIFNFIKNNPGVHFRNICRNLELEIGVVQYHLKLMVDKSYLKFYKNGRYKNYFHNDISEKEMKILSEIQKPKKKEILLFLSKNPETTTSHSIIAIKMRLTPQAISFHMKDLVQKDFVNVQKIGKKKFYKIKVSLEGKI